MAKAHHGGAWKVAYADFVTAMMALFMVLWICAQDKKILLSTSRYFQSPFHSAMTANSGVMPYEKSSQSSGSSKEDDSTSGQSQSTDQNKEIELSFLNSVAASIYRLLNLNQDLNDKPIDVQVTSDGLRMTLYDRAKSPLFVENGADFTPWGKFVMQNLAWLIDQHHFRVTIDGHTRSKLDLHRENYTGWELSADRANSARRSLVHFAVDPELIERVTGYSDTMPLPGEAPDSPSNQLITISLALSKASLPNQSKASAADIVPPASAIDGGGSGGSRATQTSAFSPTVP
jgi:chemotaxis protein MotB